jgi:hypothetical protein
MASMKKKSRTNTLTAMPQPMFKDFGVRRMGGIWCASLGASDGDEI